MPTTLRGHSMVRLDKSLVILGGYDSLPDSSYGSCIYSMACSNRNCTISLLNRKLKAKKHEFVAIPIPEKISGCTTEGKIHFQSCQKFYTLNRDQIFVSFMTNYLFLLEL